MRDIDNEMLVKNVKHLNDTDDYSDIVSDIMDDDMAAAIRENAAKAFSLDAAEENSADASDDTSEDDVEQDDLWDGIDAGV